MIALNLNPSPKELRIFAAGQVAFFALISFLLWRGGVIGAIGVWWIVGVSTVVGVSGLARPRAIRPIYAAWMLAVFPIGWTISHLVVAVVFYLVITPIGLVQRLSGRDPLQQTFDPQSRTYWQPRPPSQPTDRYFRQF